MERDLISDPSKFSSKTVGGYLTTRSFVALLFGGVCIVPVVVLTIRGVIEPEIASFLALLISLPYGSLQTPWNVPRETPSYHEQGIQVSA